MGFGFENALEEISLVLFTTLAPSSAVAFIIMSLPLIRGGLEREGRVRLAHALGLPAVLSIIGLVLSSTHLGNPANALYVISNIGSSPLSNEVVAAVVFIGVSWVYWFVSFAAPPSERRDRVWLALADACAVGFVLGIAFAYSAETVIVWDSPWAIAAVCLNSLVGGPVLALVGFAVAGVREASGAPLPRAGVRAMLAISAVALIANVAAYAALWLSVGDAGNFVARLSEYVPWYWQGLGLFSVLSAAGVALGFWRAIGSGRVPSVPVASGAAALILSGIFIMRFLFYMAHMAYGISV